MNTLLLYVFKVILCSAVLYGYYHLFLRNKSFHRYNRFYLLAAVIVSSVVPVLRIPFLFPQEAETPAFIYQTLQVIVVSGGEEELDLWQEVWANPLFSLSGLAVLSYLIVALIKMFRFSRSVRSITRIKEKYPVENIQDIQLYQTNEPGTPFSFFRNIFWNRHFPLDSDKGQQLFRHELFHVKQKHSFDNVLLEIITALFWMNPFFYLIKKELHTIHEFLSDEYATSDSDRYAYAEILLVHAIQEKKQSPLVHYFFRSPIKRRIAMILQTSSHTKFSYLRRVMILPLATLLFCTLALKAQKSVQNFAPDFLPDVLNPRNSNVEKTGINPEKNAPITVVIDPGHGGTDAGAVYNNMKEKEISLAISLKIKELAPLYNINVLLTRTDDSYPELRSRPVFAKENKADLFISVHAAADDTDHANAKSSGAHAYISGRNTTFSKENIQLGSAILQQINQIFPTNLSLLQRNTGIWVVDQAPCPAILLECGYLTNTTDAAFIKDPANQEKMARKILEGIVAYQAGEKTKLSPVKKIGFDKPETAAISTVAAKDTTPLVSPLSNFQRYMNRNIRYPATAMDQNKTGQVYFSVMMDKTGNISKYSILDKLPTVSNQPLQPSQIVIIAYSKKEHENKPAETSSNNEAFKAEVARILKMKVDMGGVSGPTQQVYLSATFKLEGTEKEVEKIFQVVENEAVFEGGVQAWARYLNQTLRYPNEAVDKNIQGTAVIQFIVKTDGSISGASILKNPGGGLGEEALRIIQASSGKWSSALQNGHKVTSYKKQPITFALQESNVKKSD